MRQLTVGSLFAGIGGFDLGLERAGMRTVWFCEQDEFCRRVLAKHWPGVPCHPDVRALVADTERGRRDGFPSGPGGHDTNGAAAGRQEGSGGFGDDGSGGLVPMPVPYVDVLCGGFPCQDISLAGRGAGLAGARSGLWGEFARLVGELRPRYVLVENVPALFSGTRPGSCRPCRARVRCGMGSSSGVSLWRPSPEGPDLACRL